MRKTLLCLVIFLTLVWACAGLQAQTSGGGGSRNPFPQPGSFPTFLEATAPNAYTWATGTGTTAPGGTSGQLQYNNLSAFGGFTLGGDCVITVPNIVCTKTNGLAFAPSATTDTTNAANISSGVLNASRLAPSPITNDCLGFNGTALFWTSCGGASGVSSFTGDGTLLSNSASVGAVTATLENAPAMSLWGNATAASAAPGYQTNAGLSSLLIQPSALTGNASLRVFGDNGSDDVARIVTHAGVYGLKVDFAGDTWLGQTGTGGNTAQLALANGFAGGAWVTVQNNSATTSYNFNLPATAGSTGQVLTSAGGGTAPMTWSSPLTNPMTTVGDVIIGGASGAATRLALGASGNCLTSNGTTVVWGACAGSGLPSSWTVGTSNLVTAAPTSGQDQTTLNITPSLASGGTFNIAQVAAAGTTPQTGCVSGVYWAIEFSGTMCMGGNALQLGAILQQSTPSFIQLFGAPGAGAYQQISSAGLPNPAQPVGTVNTAASSLAVNTYNFKVTYLAGPSQTYESAASTAWPASVTVANGQTITVPAPTTVAGETGCKFYEEDSSHGVWVLETTAVPCVSQTYSTISYATTATPPITNNTGGIYQSYLGTATAMSGAACVSATVPGPDCPAGSWIETNPMTAAGDVVYGGAVNVEGFATPTRLAIGSVGQCLGVATSTTLGWQSCGSGGSSSWSALTAPTANLTLAMGANSTTFNWTSGLQTAWDTSGNLDLSTTQAATSGSNHASPNFILSTDYWNGTASATGLWTFNAQVNSSNVALLTITPSGFGSDATGFAVSGHFVGNNTPMFTVNGDATGAVMDFEAAFSQLATIRASSPQKNLLLNAGGAGTLYLNYDSGSGGVNFANGASGVVGSVSSAGAATFNSLTLATTPLAVASGGTGQSSLAFQTSVTWVSAGTMTWTVGAGMVQNLGPITVTHATTSTLNLSGLVNGASYQIAFLQDATGGGTTTLNLGTGCTWMLAGSSDFASASSVTITPTASHGDVLAFTYDGTRCWATYK